MASNMTQAEEAAWLAAHRPAYAQARQRWPAGPIPPMCTSCHGTRMESDGEHWRCPRCGTSWRSPMLGGERMREGQTPVPEDWAEQAQARVAGEPVYADEERECPLCGVTFTWTVAQQWDRAGSVRKGGTDADAPIACSSRCRSALAWQRRRERLGATGTPTDRPVPRGARTCHGCGELYIPANVNLTAVQAVTRITGGDPSRYCRASCALARREA
jgi:predicted RNA-binding Zn-ribbon protein involved in translation (DUF1610 family)